MGIFSKQAKNGPKICNNFIFFTSLHMFHLRCVMHWNFHMLVLKGTVSRDFLLLVFFMNQFPPRPRVLHLDNFENSRRYSRVKVHHRYQRHRRQIFTPFSLALLIPVAICHRLSTIPVPPASLTPVANIELRISPWICKKNWKDPNGIIRGLGETDSRKKPEAKNLVTLSL